MPSKTFAILRSNPYLLHELAILLLAIIGVYVGVQQTRQGRHEQRRASMVEIEPTEMSCGQLCAQGPDDNRHIRLTHFHAGSLHAFERPANDRSNGVAFVPLFVESDGIVPSPSVPFVIARFQQVPDPGHVRRLSKRSELTGLVWDDQLIPAPIQQELSRKYPQFDIARSRLIDVDASLPTLEHGQSNVQFGFIFTAITTLMSLAIVVQIVRSNGSIAKQVRRPLPTIPAVDAPVVPLPADRQTMFDSLMGRPMRKGRDIEVPFLPTPHGFLVARDTERFEYMDNDVVGLRFEESSVDVSAEFTLQDTTHAEHVRRTLTIRVVRDGIEVMERGIVELTPDQPDPLGQLYVRLLGTLETKAWQALDHGEPVGGENWTISQGQLHLPGCAPVRCDDVSRVAWRQGTLEIWQGNGREPFARLGENEDNVVLLSQLMKRLLAERFREASVV